MEKQFFDWTGWDALDEGVIIFNDLTFKSRFGPYLPGIRYQNASAVVDIAKGFLEVYSQDGKTVVYRATLKFQIDTVEI